MNLHKRISASKRASERKRTTTKTRKKRRMKTNEYNMIHAYIAFLCVTFRFNTLLFFLSCCNGCMYSCVCVCVSIRMQFVLSLLLFVISFVPWNCLFHVEFDRFVFHLYHECVQYSSVERQSKQYAIISER